MAESDTPPKVFISYSWTSEGHKEWVLNLATRLSHDAVDVILDRFDLRPGHDTYAFMEQMVTDPTVQKVLVVCDAAYAAKADARKGGVGVEAQIISAEVYNKVSQEKFVPLIRGHDESGQPHDNHRPAKVRQHAGEGDLPRPTHRLGDRQEGGGDLPRGLELGRVHRVVTAEAPTKGLRYEKQDNNLPFMTWDEVERRAQRAASPKGAAALWDALFLNVPQVADCLDHVNKTADTPFVYPMFVFATHTGARRSEMMRSRVEDIDFEARVVTIREKKKDRTKRETQRSVRMTPLHERMMKEWSYGHPGGPYTFCHGEEVARSRKRSRTTGH